MRKGSKTLSIAIKGQKTSSFKKNQPSSVVTFLEQYPGEDPTPPLKKERETNKQTNK